MNSNILQTIQCESQQIQENFLNLVINNGKFEKLNWALYKEIRMNIPIFLKKFIFPILEQNQQNSTMIINIEQQEQNMNKNTSKTSLLPPKLRSTLHYRQLLKLVLEEIKDNQLEKEYEQKLLKMIYAENTMKIKSKNQQNFLTKFRMTALILYVYQHSEEKKKNVFNIVQLWSYIYPQEYLWKIDLKNETLIKKQGKRNIVQDQLDLLSQELLNINLNKNETQNDDIEEEDSFTNTNNNKIFEVKQVLQERQLPQQQQSELEFSFKGFDSQSTSVSLFGSQ